MSAALATPLKKTGVTWSALCVLSLLSALSCAELAAPSGDHPGEQPHPGSKKASKTITWPDPKNVGFDSMSPKISFEREQDSSAQVLSNTEFSVSISSTGFIRYSSRRVSIKGKWSELHLDMSVRAAELCKGGPFLSLSGNRNGREVSMLVDLQTGKTYERALLHIGAAERRWSKEGQYTFLRHEDGILVLPTAHLRSFLEGKNGRKRASYVMGHPLGATVQLGWIEEVALIYETGISELRCRGLLGLKNRQNYFLGCCTLPKVRAYIPKCRKQDDSYRELYRAFRASVMSGKAIKISGRFWEDAQERLKNARRRSEASSEKR